MNDVRNKSIAARSEIFSDLKRNLDIGDEKAREKRVRERLSNPPRNLIPERANIPHSEQIALFREQIEAVSATVEQVAAAADVPAALASFLRDNNLPSRLRLGSDEALNALPWNKTPNVDVQTGRAVPEDAVSLSRAFKAVAETGTLILLSGADNPTTLNFLPDTHIVVVSAKDVVGTYEEAWTHLRETQGKGSMPRALNMISGPSRTADVEQTIQLGAHGPRQQHIIIVDDL